MFLDSERPLYLLFCCRLFAPFSFLIHLTAGLIPWNLDIMFCRHVRGLHRCRRAADSRPSSLHPYVLTCHTESPLGIFFFYLLATCTRALPLHLTAWMSWSLSLFVRSRQSGNSLPAVISWFHLRVELFCIFLYRLFCCRLRPAMFLSTCASSYSCYAQVLLSLFCSSGARAEAGSIWDNNIGLPTAVRVSYTRVYIWLNATVALQLLLLFCIYTIGSVA